MPRSYCEKGETVSDGTTGDRKTAGNRVSEFPGLADSTQLHASEKEMMLGSSHEVVGSANT